MANIPISIVLFVIITHWFSDFYKQTDAMAQGKSESNYWLSMHVLTYYTCFCIAGVFLNLFGIITISFVSTIVWIFLNAVLHWITDWFTSRVSSQLWRDKKVHDFFVCIGFDQMIHYVTWFTTYLIFT
jgi:hypothetical protein